MDNVIQLPSRKVPEKDPMKPLYTLLSWMSDYSESGTLDHLPEEKVDKLQAVLLEALHQSRMLMQEDLG